MLKQPENLKNPLIIDEKQLFIGCSANERMFFNFFKVREIKIGIGMI